MCKRDPRIKKIEEKIENLHSNKASLKEEYNFDVDASKMTMSCRECWGVYLALPRANNSRSTRFCYKCNSEYIDKLIDKLKKQREIGLLKLEEQGIKHYRENIWVDVAKKERRRLKEYSDHTILDNSGIYFIYDKTNRRIYVGKSNSIRTRLHQHLTEMKNSTHVVEPLNRINPDTLQYDYILQEGTGVDDLETLERIVINYVDECGIRMYNQHMNRLVLSDYAQILERVGPMVDKVLEGTKANHRNTRHPLSFDPTLLSYQSTHQEEPQRHEAVQALRA